MKKLATLLLTMLACAPAFAQSDLEQWANIPADKAALILRISEMQNRTLVVQDATGGILDAVKWSSKLPLLKQYLLPPGKYELRLPDLATSPISSLALDLRAGTPNIVSVSPAIGDVRGTAYLIGWSSASENTQQRSQSFPSNQDTKNLSRHRRLARKGT